MPSPRALISTTVLAALLLGAPGCGDEAPPEQPSTVQAPEPAPAAEPAALTRRERDLLTVYDRRINAHCVRVARSLVDPKAAPSAGQEARAFAAADSLVALAAAKPDAPLGAGQDTRLFLADVLENLDGSNCDPAMASRLAQGLAQIPSG